MSHAYKTQQYDIEFSFTSVTYCHTCMYFLLYNMLFISPMFSRTRNTTVWYWYFSYFCNLLPSIRLFSNKQSANYFTNILTCTKHNIMIYLVYSYICNLLLKLSLIFVNNLIFNKQTISGTKNTTLWYWVFGYICNLLLKVRLISFNNLLFNKHMFSRTPNTTLVFCYRITLPVMVQSPGS